MPRDSATSKITACLARTPLAALAYLLLTLLMTFPLVIEFTTSLPDGGGDIWQNYWNLWWWKKALLELGQHPYFSSFIFHPTGAKLIFHTHSPLNMLMALPVTAVLGPTAAYNFCIIVALWLSGLCMYLLAKELTGDARAAFLAGLVFAFFPHRMEQIFEHLNLVSAQFMPLTLFFLVRLRRAGGWKNVAGFGGSFAANALYSWHLGLMLILVLLAPLALAVFVKRERPLKDLLRDVAVAALIAVALLLPAAAPMVVEMASTPEHFYHQRAQNLGIDAAYLWIPHYGHSLWGGATTSAYIQTAYSAAGFMCYLGFVPLAMGLLAVARRRRDALFWFALLGFGLVLALGRHPLWNGRLIESVTLPFYLLEQVPVFNLLRVANRFMIPATLALAVLTAFGWTALRRRSDLAFCLLAGLICLEYSWIPYPTRKVEISPIYQRLADSGRTGAVLPIPFHLRSRSGPNLAAQTVHNLPMADGYVSTVPAGAGAFIGGDPMLSQLVGQPKLEGPLDDDHLRKLGFDTVIINKQKLDSYGEKVRAQMDPADITGRRTFRRMQGIPDEVYQHLRSELIRCCGEPWMEDDRVVVFDLNRGTDPPPATR